MATKSKIKDFFTAHAPQVFLAICSVETYVIQREILTHSYKHGSIEEMLVNYIRRKLY